MDFHAVRTAGARGLILSGLVSLGLTSASGPASGEPSSPRLRALVAEHLDHGDVDGLWVAVSELADAGGYPIVETITPPVPTPSPYVQVTFLHRGGDPTPDNVLLFANVNHVVPEELLFERIADTDVYHRTVWVPEGVRFEYRILENDPLTGLFAAARYGTRMHLLGADPDPLSPIRRVFPDGLGEGRDYITTWVELPGAPPQPHLVDRGAPRGTLLEEVVHGNRLGYARDVQIFLPPGHDPSRAYPLVVILDGSSYFAVGNLQRTLENLIAENRIPPVVVLGIDAGTRDGVSQRNQEFTCDPGFTAALREEILPWLADRVRVTGDPARRVIAGSSFGGLFATYFAYRHPELFSNVLSQSGSFHWGRAEDEVPFEWLIRELASGPVKPLRLFLEVGVLEGEYVWNNPGFPHQIVSHRHFETVLDLRGYDVAYREYGGGHEMLSWQGGVADGLMHLLGENRPR